MKFDAAAAREFANGLGYLDGAGPEVRLWLHNAIDAVDAAQQDAYAEGRKDQREEDAKAIAALATTVKLGLA